MAASKAGANKVVAYSDEKNEETKSYDSYSDVDANCSSSIVPSDWSAVAELAVDVASSPISKKLSKLSPVS